MVEFPGSPIPPAPYWILDTDYETFAAVYACREDSDGSVIRENSWILTRDNRPSEEVVSVLRKRCLGNPREKNPWFLQLVAANEAFTSRGLSVDDFADYPHPDICTYTSPNPPSCNEDFRQPP